MRSSVRSRLAPPRKPPIILAWLARGWDFYFATYAAGEPSGGHSFILLQNENAPDSSSRGTSVEQPSPRTAQEQCSNQPRRSEWHARASGRHQQAGEPEEKSSSQM